MGGGREYKWCGEEDVNVNVSFVRELCGDAILLDLDCGGGITNIHDKVAQNYKLSLHHCQFYIILYLCKGFPASSAVKNLYARQEPQETRV